MAEFTSSFYSTKLHANVKGVSARGGASMIEVNDHLIIFGGADREPCHFQDMVIYRPAAGSKFESLKVKSENIPMPRSGHAVAGFGKYMFLFGGLDYPEEAVYNDLYLFSTDNMEWYYVGESGIEVPARSSHTLGIVSGTTSNGKVKHYLVVYGGAAPEPGLYSDTIYAELPSDPNSIDLETFAVEWKSLTQPGPGERESHASCTSREGHLYISGGKTGTDVPALMQDVWRLSVSTAAAAEAEGTARDPLVWECLKSLQLPEPRCVHGMCAGVNGLYIFGGFTGVFPGDLLAADLTVAASGGEQNAWETVSVAPEGRVGLSMCAVSQALVQRLTSSSIYSPLFRNQPVTESDTNIMIFGGSTLEKDLGDIWLLRKKPVWFPTVVTTFRMRPFSTATIIQFLLGLDLIMLPFDARDLQPSHGVINDGKFPDYMRRLCDFKQMDFEATFDQLLTLISIEPQKVYTSFYYRKQTKDQWARDDPAFLVVQAFFVAITALAYGIAFMRPSFWGYLWAVGYSLIIDWFLVGFCVASTCSHIANKYMRQYHAHTVEQEVEWLYAFDVHANAFFCSFLVTHVVQYFLLPLLMGRSFLACVLSNTLYAAACIWYAYITHLGYRALPFLGQPQKFLWFPIVAVCTLWTVALVLVVLGLRINMTRIVMAFHFG